MDAKIEFGISRITELEFSINQKKIAEDNAILASNVLYTTDVKKEEFEIQIGCTIKSKSSSELLLNLRVSTVFKIKDLKKHLGKDGLITLPDPLLISMISISISHTRAFLAKNTSGTLYSNYYLPLVNPTEVAKQVFKLGEPKKPK